MGLLVALLLVAEPGQGAPPPFRVESIEVRGLWISRELIVRRELPFKEGDVVTPELWELAVARLWNMGPFSRVALTLEPPGSGHVVVTVEDRFTLNPLFSFGVGGGAFWVRAGANDINFLGRFIELGVRYERFGEFNGFQAWVRDPRLFGRRLDGQLLGEWLFRPRPGYFLLRRATLRGELYVESNDGRVRVGAYGQGALDDVSRLEGLAEAPAPHGRALYFGASLRVGRVDVVRIRQQGWSLEVWPGLAVTDDPRFSSYPVFFAQGLHFTTLGERWNLAFRAQVGFSPGARPQDRFFLGGLDPGTPPTNAMQSYPSGIRGYEDGFVRTQGYASFNAEVRFVAFDWMWLAIMPAVFVDAAAAQPERGGAVVPMVSAGGGVRLLSPRLVRTGLRGDLAVPLVGTKPTVGFSFGVYQFF